MKREISLEQQQELASKILKIDLDMVKKKGFMLEDSNVFVITVSLEGEEIPSGYKGGAKTLLIDINGEVLAYAGSALSIDKLYKEFQNGKRTPIDKLF